MIGYLRLELRRALRDPRYLALVIGWPVASYLLFSTIFGARADSAEGLSPRVEIMVAMAAFGAMGAVLLATGPRMATDRQVGWLRQLDLTPLSAARVLAVRVAAAMALALPTICLTFGVAAGAKGVDLAAWEWVAMAGLMLVGCLPFAALGVVLGMVMGGDGATGVTTMAYIFLAMLGGLFVPTKIFPPAMATLAGALPSNRLAELGWRVAGGHAPPLAALAVLGGWFAAASLGALALSRRRASSST